MNIAMVGQNDSVVAVSDVPVGAETLLREACDELERRLRSGEAARVEEFLARHPVLGRDPEQAMDLIYVEYATRRELGESPPRDQFFSRFPQWRTLLERQFEFDEFIDDETTHREKRDGSRSDDRVEAGSVPISSRFRVLRLFARGGIGQVMRAMDTELNREVAVKEIQPALAGSDQVRQRFLREAEITGKLEHPGVVPVYGLGRDAEGRPFYAMRLVRGRSFHEAVEDFHRHADHANRFHGVEFQKMLRRFLHVCETVAYAHSRGVIHRDIKPANILLGPFGETLLVDWGLARAIEPSGPRGVPAVESSSPQAAEPNDRGVKNHGPADTATITPAPGSDRVERAVPVAHWADQLTQATGEVIGTPAFMSPEQARGEAHGVGPASDVYSLGAALFMLLTGQAPFGGSAVDETLRRVVAGSYPRPRELNRAIPPPLEAVCLKAMARRPADRYAGPRELADDIEHWLADEPVSAARDSTVARLARWGRRHRTRVIAGSIALVLITIVSVAAAILVNAERLRADRERQDANRQRNAADEQRIEADRQNARLAFDRGFAHAESNEHGIAMLWFARALEHAPADDAGMRRVILANLNAARHHLLRRRVTLDHPAAITKMVFSPDGTKCLTADRRGTVRVWDPDAAAVTAAHELDEPRVFDATARRVLTAMVRDDGTSLVAVAFGRKLVLRSFGAAAGDAAADVELDHPDNLIDAAFSPDATRICTVAGKTTGSTPAHIRMWRTDTGERLMDFDGHAAVQRVAFQPSGRAFATQSRADVRLWRMRDGQAIGQPIKLAGTSVSRFVFTPAGQLLLGGADGSLSCWNATTGTQVSELPRMRSEVTGMACVPSGGTAVATSADGTARFLYVPDRQVVDESLRLDRHSALAAFRPRSRQVLIALESHSAVLWDRPDWSELEKATGENVISVAYSPDGGTAVTGAANGRVGLYDVATGRPIRPPATIHDGRIECVAFRPNGAVFMTGGADGTAQLWNAADGSPRGEPMKHRTETAMGIRVTRAVFSPDPEGRFALTGDSVGRVRIWNGDTGELIRKFTDPEFRGGQTTSACFNFDGTRIAAGFGRPDNGVRVWDTDRGDLLWPAARHDDSVRVVTVSPDGRIVMSVSNDKTTRLWDAMTGEPIGSGPPHHGEVHAAAFSPDGRLAVTGGYDAIVRLWEVPSGRLVGEPMRHNHLVRAAAFSSDGKTLVTAGADATARLWDVATCLPLRPPLRHIRYVEAVALDPTGRTALTGRIWRVPAPLPDDPPLIALWTQVATQRVFSTGGHVDWLTPDSLAAATAEFEARTGTSWSAWADAARDSTPSDSVDDGPSKNRSAKENP